MSDKKTFATLMLLLATMLWGLSYSVQSVVGEVMTPFKIVFYRGIGGLFLLPVILVQKRKIDKDALIGGLVMGVMVFLGLLLQQIGISLSTVSKASFITALYIVFVPIIESFAGRKVGKKILISIALAVLGLYFLCMNSVNGLNIGDLSLLLCAIVFAFQIMFIDHYSKENDPLVLTMISQTTMAVLALIAVLFTEGIDPSAARTVILPLFYLAFIGGLFAQLLQNRFQKDLGPSLASLVMSFESVFGALFGWLLLGQVMSVRELLGCVLVFAAILIAELGD